MPIWLRHQLLAANGPWTGFSAHRSVVRCRCLSRRCPSNGRMRDNPKQRITIQSKSTGTPFVAPIRGHFTGQGYPGTVSSALRS